MSVVLKLFGNKRRKGPASAAGARKRGFLTRRVLQDASVGLLALLTGALFFGTNLLYNHGVPVAPLDDAFIHLQYGRQIGEGQWFRYNDGAPISTGASSFLYPVILGAGSGVLGLGGAHLLTFAVVVGILLFAVTAVLGCELGRVLAGEEAGLWTGALIATNGALAWGATSGMEVALLAALVSAALLAFLREYPDGRFLLTPVFLALAALTRPEGIILSAVLVGTMLLRTAWAARERGVGLGRTVAGALLVLLPLAAGAGQTLFYRWATGTANGVQAKSILYEPIFYPGEVLGRAATNLLGLTRDLLFGFHPDGYLLPGAIFFAALGVSRLVFRGAGFRAFALAVALGVALVLASVATLNSWDWQHHRYVLPFFPILLLLMVVGMGSVSPAPAGNDGAERRRYASRALLGLALLFSLIALPAWAAKMGQESAETREQPVSIGRWIDRNLPPGARVGVNDAGAMRYYGDRPVVDLVGLTTNGLAEPYRNGTASLYEALEDMEPGERPDYFFVYPTWTEGLGDSGVLGDEPLRSFVLTRPLPNTVTGQREEVVAYEANWTLARSGDLPKEATGGSVRDAIDVADLASEEEHGYEMRMSRAGLQPGSLLERGTYPSGEPVADGGRRITGDEAFTVRNLTPGRPLTIVARTSAAELGANTEDPPILRVSVDGRDAGEWDFRHTAGGDSDGEWRESSFAVPAELVRSGSVRVELLSSGRYAPYRSHAPFHYWFVQ